LAKAYVSRQVEVLEKQNEKQQEQNDLIEKQNDLMKAQHKLIRVYREGKGFVYEQDTEAVKEATQALKEYQQQQDSPQLKAWKEVLELFDEMESLAEIKQLEQTVGSTTSSLFGSLGTDSSKWTNWIKDNLATTMGLEGLLTQMEDITSYEDMMKFLQGNNDTISNAQIASSVNKYRFASGTSFVPHTGFARVAEQGYEIAVLGKGDAVMPHNVSKNLMDWGNYSPIEFAKATSDSGDNVYNFDKLVLPNVANANDFMRELQQLPNRAIQFGTSRA
jgi:ribosome-binding protein aMBF1 (putative translation factor)